VLSSALLIWRTAVFVEKIFVFRVSRRQAGRRVPKHWAREDCRRNSEDDEGYRVSRDLIDRVRTGNWDPDNDNGENSGDVANQDHCEW